MHPSAARVAAGAAARNLTITIVEYDASTRTAADAAAAIGTTVAQIVKSLVFLAADEPVMALVSGVNRLDEKKLAAWLGVGRKQVRRADADSVRRLTGYAIGGVPPFGHDTPLRVVIDADLMQFDAVWAAAGTPHAVFMIRPPALLKVTGGTVLDLKQEAA